MVLTLAALTHYIGDLDAVVSDILISHMSRGLLRLEGFALRLHPDSVSCRDFMWLTSSPCISFASTFSSSPFPPISNTFPRLSSSTTSTSMSHFRLMILIVTPTDRLTKTHTARGMQNGWQERDLGRTNKYTRRSRWKGLTRLRCRGDKWMRCFSRLSQEASLTKAIQVGMHLHRKLTCRSTHQNHAFPSSAQSAYLPSSARAGRVLSETSEEVRRQSHEESAGIWGGGGGEEQDR